METSPEPPEPRRPRRAGVPGGPARPATGLFLVALAALATPRPADAQIGVMAGYSRDSLGELMAGPGFQLADQADGFHTGIFLDVGIGRFAVRPGIVYRRLQHAAFSGVERTAVDIEIVEFPLDVRVSAPLPVAKPYVLAGAALMFPSSARNAIDQGLPGTRVRLDLGVGLEWNIGFRLWPEIRYGRGLGGLAGSEAEAAAGESSSLDTFMVRLGVSF